MEKIKLMLQTELVCLYKLSHVTFQDKTFKFLKNENYVASNVNIYIYSTIHYNIT